MNSLKGKLETFQRSGAGMFIKKVLDDQVPNLAALVAWGTLSTLLPLLMGILAIAGLVLRDPQRLDQVYATITAALPADKSGPIGQALEGVRQASAAPAGAISLVILLISGSSFFANMATIFDQAYHVQSRNPILQRVVSLVMLIIVSALLVLSTLALGIGSLLGNVPLGLGTNPVVGRIVSWSLSIVSAILVFVLLYKILPNAGQTWRHVLPGALLSTVLFFAILGLFPLYVSLFPPNHAYAVMGVFLVFTFFLYLLGFVFVLGAELNAFLQEPARALALAEATERAQHGKAQYAQPPGAVEAEASGRAPAEVRGVKPPLGAPKRDMPVTGTDSPDAGRGTTRGPTLAGRVLGLVGLLAAVVLLRNRSPESA